MEIIFKYPYFLTNIMWGYYEALFYWGKTKLQKKAHNAIDNLASERKLTGSKDPLILEALARHTENLEIQLKLASRDDAGPNVKPILAMRSRFQEVLSLLSSNTLKDNAYSYPSVMFMESPTEIAQNLIAMRGDVAFQIQRTLLSGSITTRYLLTKYTKNEKILCALRQDANEMVRSKADSRKITS